MSLKKLAEFTWSSTRRTPLISNCANTLRALYRVSAKSTAPARKPKPIDGERPLAHQSHFVFQVVREIVSASEPHTARELEALVPDAWPAAITKTIQRLKRDGVITISRSRILLSPQVPEAFVRFVRKTKAALTNGKPARVGVDRVRAFVRAKDRAPQLFGTDLRLRTLMALAKHGPMNVRDLRRLLGGSTIRAESAGYAMFGRAGVVIEWRTKDDRYAALDPRFPLVAEFKSLLREMERHYPLREYRVQHPVPKVPLQRKKWNGDHRALFGGPIATAILLTIAALGWSFEALCVMYAVGYDRVVTKKVVKRLEEQGVIVGDRKRKPGFNVRALRLSESFCAYRSLEKLLRSYVCEWSDVEAEVCACLERLPPRTKAHLRRRGLLGP